MITKQISSNIPPAALQSKSVVSGADADGVIAITLTANRIILHGIQCSYSAAPTGGSLIITDGTYTWNIDLNDTPFAFECAIPFTNDITATIKAGGAAVVGKLNLQYTEEF